MSCHVKSSLSADKVSNPVFCSLRARPHHTISNRYHTVAHHYHSSFSMEALCLARTYGAVHDAHNRGNLVSQKICVQGVDDGYSPAHSSLKVETARIGMG
jgi:hypothetical protein